MSPCLKRTVSELTVSRPSLRLRNMVNVLVAICMLTGFSIMTASFVIYEVQEHHTGSKRLQHISGISETFYWTVNFFYDMVRDSILHAVGKKLCYSPEKKKRLAHFGI